MKNISNILWGLVFVALGVIVGINTLGIADINIFFDGWWTLIIIIPSCIDFIKGRDKTGSLIGIIVGVLLLLGCQDIIDFELIWKLLVPIILVIIGLSLIFKDSLKSSLRRELKKLNNKKNEKEYCATFGAQKINFDNQKFDGADLNAIFGGLDIDLTKAEIIDNSVINISSIFGGTKVKVPDDVNIKVISTSIFGGVSNKKPFNDKCLKTIYINTTCLFGGVDII